MTRKQLFLLVLLTTGSAVAGAGKEIYTTFLSNLALQGYDPVAYFRQGKAVKGSREYRTEYRKAEWRFASRENLERFREEPERYAPRYGGYCAWAMAKGEKAAGNPLFWTLVGDRLYLNYDGEIQDKWLQDRDDLIRAADHNWQRMH